MTPILVAHGAPSVRVSLGAPRPARRTVSPVFASKKGGRGGIHDPAGPTGSVGAGEANARKEQLAQEESFRVAGQHLAAEDLRSSQRAGGHAPGSAGVDRIAAASAELREIDEERAQEEWDHMGRVDKWFMEAKNLLYSWLKTGVEPL